MQGLIESRQGHGFAICVALIFGGTQAGRYYVSAENAGTGIFLVGGLAGLLALYLFAWLLRNFGRWFGGQASLREVRVGFGWGLMPWTLLFLFLTAALAVSGDPAFLANFYWIFFIGFIYGYAVLLSSLSVALRLSIWKTFFCLVVAVLVSVFPLTWFLQTLSALI